MAISPQSIRVCTPEGSSPAAEVEESAGAPPPAPVFRDIFQANLPFVWRCLRRLGVPRADVEDVCQEVFVVVLKKLPDFDARLSLRAWIYGICVRKASDHRRLAYRAREQVTPSVPEGAVTPSQEEDVDRERARGVLDQALAELDDDRRAVFVLFEIEQLSMSDVAAALGCPLQTAYSRLYAARKQIEAAVRRQRARSAP